MPMLPGPDRPAPKKAPVKRKRVVVAKKKPVRKTTKRNVYTSAPPRVRTPAPPSAATAGRPAPAPQGVVPPGPYDRFKDIPGALAGFAQINADQNQHQTYVNDKVAPWMTAGLQGLAQINTDAQNQYMGNVQNGAVAGAIAPNQMSGGPGGIVAGNNSFLTGAGQEYARASGSTAQQVAAYQGAMNKMQPTTLSQGYINSLADYAKGLPALYSERRRAFTEKLEGYLAEVQQAQAEAQYEQAQWQAEFDEKSRHNRVTESISATNASTNAAFQASRLGLDANDQAFDQQQDLTAQSTPAPAGYLRDPASGKLYRDPSVPQARAPGSGGGNDTDKQYGPNQLRKEGFVRLNPKAGPKWRDRATRATDGSLWIKKGSGSGGSSSAPTAPRKATELETELLDLYKPGDIGGWEERYENDPTGAGKRIAMWVRENKPDFIVKGRKANIAKLKAVLSSIGGRPAAEALSIIVRGYISSDGNWK